MKKRKRNNDKVKNEIKCDIEHEILTDKYDDKMKNINEKNIIETRQCCENKNQRLEIDNCNHEMIIKDNHKDKEKTMKLDDDNHENNEMIMKELENTKDKEKKVSKKDSMKFDEHNEIKEIEKTNEKKMSKKESKKLDDTIELLNFALDLDNGIIELPKKIEKVKKETLTVPNPTSVKSIIKSNDFYPLEGTFPQILHQIIARECKKNIISWSIDGTSFHISDFTFFLTGTCSHYFEKINYNSFKRNMKNYGFEVIEGENLNINERTNTITYFHPKFQRDNYDMTNEIVRVEQKNNKINNYSKKEINDDNGINIDGVDVIDNFEKDHEIDRPNFFRDIQEMMFGFGDSWPPNKNATLLIDRLVTTYITELAQRAELVAETTGKLDKECFLYLIRKDEFKFSRVMKLIDTNEQIKNIKQQSIKNNDDDNYDDADY